MFGAPAREAAVAAGVRARGLGREKGRLAGGDPELPRSGPGCPRTRRPGQEGSQGSGHSRPRGDAWTCRARAVPTAKATADLPRCGPPSRCSGVRVLRTIVRVLGKGSRWWGPGVEGLKMQGAALICSPGEALFSAE